MSPQLRIARPVSALARSASMYRAGLGLIELGRFENHAGFDGVLLGRPGLDWHLELTYCRTHPVRPSPTPEDLLVFYVHDEEEWGATCGEMLKAGFIETRSFNPYWQVTGRSFEDPDGYRIVIQHAAPSADH